ncbi:MAG: dipeptidase, partial [Actinomycetota bacterium]
VSERIEAMVAANVPTGRILGVIDDIPQEALVRNELPEFWAGWAQSGVDVSSVTVGAFGERPFGYDNAVRDLAGWTRSFDLLPRFLKVIHPADAIRTKQENRHGIILNFQDTTHIGSDLDKLNFFYDLGVRIIQLTYNHRNLVGDGCTERSPSGLSLFGLDVVRRMNELGILVDVSHCGEPTTLDAIEASTKPVAVTHSFCRALSDHDRGKSDDVIRALGDAGGYFGVLLVPFFITADPVATLDHFVAHFERVVDLIGPDQVGVGTDWGARFPKPLIDLLNEEVRRLGFREEHRVDWNATVEGFRDWREWPNITGALVDRGYSDDEITGFLGANFLRVLERPLGRSVEGTAARSGESLGR